MYANTYSEEKVEKKLDSAEKDLVVYEATKKKILRSLVIFWLISTVFLFLRMFLEALGSDPKSLFAAFIYLISGLFLLPFFGIFPHFGDTIQPGRPTFDAPAITAVFCYTVLVILAMVVILIATKMLKTGKQVDETVAKDNPVDPTESERVVK